MSHYALGQFLLKYRTREYWVVQPTGKVVKRRISLAKIRTAVTVAQWVDRVEKDTEELLKLTL